MATIFRQLAGGDGGNAETLDSIDSTAFARTDVATDFQVQPTFLGSPILTAAPGTIVAAGYQHTQAVGSTIWTIDHNLNTDKISVQVFDSSNKVIDVNEIEKVTVNQIKVYFLESQTGTASIVPYE